MGKLILSAFSDEYCDDFIGQLKALHKYAIGYIELRRANGKNVADMTSGDISVLRSALDRYGIKVSSIGSPLGKISLDGDMKEHFERAKRIFDMANALESPFVRIFSFYIPNGKSAEECRGEVLDRVGELIRLAEGFGVTLCHENEALIYGESPERCFELLKTFDGRLKCVFDMGNFVLDGYDPLNAYKLLSEYVAYLHIKDALYAGAVVPAGKGEACIGEILDLVKNRSGKTFVTLEPHLQTFDGLNALVGKSFENPYRYESAAAAFDDAVACLRKLLP